MREQDEKNMRRVAFFVLLSLFLHALLGSVFYRLQEKMRAQLPPPPPAQEVVWVNPQGAPPPVPVVSAQGLQLADIAKPKVEQAPDRTRFAARYNSKVKDETVAAKIPKNAKLDSETAEDGKKGDNAQEPAPPAPRPKKVAMKEPEPAPAKDEPEEKPEAAEKEPAAEPPPPEKQPTQKQISLSDLSLKPSDYKDLIPKESATKKDTKVAMREPTSKGEPFVSPLKGRPGAPGDFDSFAHDFFPNVKIGDKTYLNTAAFPDVQYFTQLKRIFRMRFNPAPPLRQHFAGNRVVVGTINCSMAVTVSPDGRLKELFVVKSSGIPGYDEEALRTVRESAPFSSPPQKVLDKDGILRMNWNFITYL